MKVFSRTLTIMPSRILNPPCTLDSRVTAAMADGPKKLDGVDVGAAERSVESAVEITKHYSNEAKQPLANHAPNQDQKQGITFAAQDKLPKLPIPDLEATCKRYLGALEPLQTAREHNDTERAVEEFLRGDGPELQERLKKYATGKSSYIEQFCMWLRCFGHSAR